LCVGVLLRLLRRFRPTRSPPTFPVFRKFPRGARGRAYSGAPGRSIAGAGSRPLAWSIRLQETPTSRLVSVHTSRARFEATATQVSRSDARGEKPLRVWPGSQVYFCICICICVYGSIGGAFILTRFSAVCWGDQPNVAAPSGTVFLLISAGSTHACGLTLNGSISCWGGDDPSRLASPAGVGYVHVACGDAHMCVVDGAGSARCFGANDQGQSLAPQGVNFTQLTCGDTHSCGLVAGPGGEVMCWGSDVFGQTGVPASLVAAPVCGSGVPRNGSACASEGCSPGTWALTGFSACVRCFSGYWCAGGPATPGACLRSCNVCSGLGANRLLFASSLGARGDLGMLSHA
jgi:Regulator of chromosome condensation (RCC1) repeat